MRKFSDCIPGSIIETAPVNFVRVLDGLQAEKQSILGQAFRVNNPLLLNDQKWLLYRLADYGFDNVPYGLPIPVLQQVLLNAATIVKLRGSKIGLNLFLSVFTLGEVNFNSLPFYTNNPDFIIPSDILQGYLCNSNGNLGPGSYDLSFSNDYEDEISDGTNIFYLLDNNDYLQITGTLAISIRSRYYNNTTLKSYLQKEVYSWMGFNDGTGVTLTFSNRTAPYYHPLLNQKFV